MDGFDIRRIQIRSASVDLGRGVLRNKWLLETLGKLARSNLVGETSAWFTPLRISMHDVRVRYERRMDLLFKEKYHLATWGDVDLAGDRLRLVLAIMPETMRTLFHLRSASRSDTVQIGISGSLGKPRIDLGPTIRSIAAIKAKELAIRKLPRLVRGIAEKGLRKLRRKNLKGMPQLAASVGPLPWEKAADKGR